MSGPCLASNTFLRVNAETVRCAAHSCPASGRIAIGIPVTAERRQMDEGVLRSEADPHHKDSWQQAAGGWQERQSAKRFRY